MVVPRIVLALLAASLLVPAPAAAQRCVAPPGTAAIDQYCETIPTARGDRGSGTPQPPPAAVVVPRRTLKELAASGAEGAALNRELGAAPESAAASGRPARPDGQGVKGERAQGTPAPRTQGTPAQAPSANPLDAVRESATGGTTLGSGFSWLLLIVTLALVAWAWIGVRGRRTD